MFFFAVRLEIAGLRTILFCLLIIKIQHMGNF